MLYRDFVEVIKDAAEAYAAGLRGGRDLTPTVHFESEGTVQAQPLDMAFFEDQQSRSNLVRVVASLAAALGAQKVGWTFTGTERQRDFPGGEPGEWDTTEVLCAVLVDRERYEIWTAPLRRHDDRPARIGGWTNMANRGTGFLVTPIQEALR